MQASYGRPSINRPSGTAAAVAAAAAVGAGDRSSKGIINKEAAELPAEPQGRDDAAHTRGSEQWRQPTQQQSNKQHPSDEGYSRQRSQPPAPPPPPPPQEEGLGVEVATRMSRHKRGGGRRRGRDRSEGRGAAAAAAGPARQDREKKDAKDARDGSERNQPSLESLRWPPLPQEGVVGGVKTTRSSRRRPEI